MRGDREEGKAKETDRIGREPSRRRRQGTRGGKAKREKKKATGGTAGRGVSEAVLDDDSCRCHSDTLIRRFQLSHQEGEFEDLCILLTGSIHSG